MSSIGITSVLSALDEVEKAAGEVNFQFILELMREPLSPLMLIIFLAGWMQWAILGMNSC